MDYKRQDKLIGTIWRNSHGLDNNDQARLATAIEPLLAEAWDEGYKAGDIGGYDYGDNPYKAS